MHGAQLDFQMRNALNQRYIRSIYPSHNQIFQVLKDSPTPSMQRNNNFNGDEDQVESELCAMLVDWNTLNN
jgi:hypothetical protein